MAAPAFRRRNGQLFSRPWGRVLRHVAAWALWAAFVAFEYYLIWVHKEAPVVLEVLTAGALLAAVGSYYFFSGVVLPRWLLRRRWLLTALGLVAIYYFSALLFHAGFYGLDHYGLFPKTLLASPAGRIVRTELSQSVFSWQGIGISLTDFTTIVLPPILLRFVRFLLASSNRSLQLERENLALEINFLKAQVNPHFLFNTLNNIYTMVVKQDARAPAMVQHLTDLMHYTVHEAAAPLVPLAQEIGFIEAYLELERLRYGQKVRIDYHPSGAPDGLGITPLLFFPFVENAFKHGVDNSLEASWVAIEVAVRGPQLHFAVRNSCGPAASQRTFGGVGIANVRKRLALHYAPADYQLTIAQDADTYQVVLTLRLLALEAAAPAPTAISFVTK